LPTLCSETRIGAGRYDEALEAYRRAEELGFGNFSFRLSEATALAHLGRTEEALAIVREKESTPAREHEILRLATALMALGEEGRAFAALESAADARNPDLPNWLVYSVAFDETRADPRFRAIIDRLGLPD